MVQPCDRVGRGGGRPRKYSDGWGSANTRIYMAKEVFLSWRTTRARLNFRSDSNFAKYLLNCHNSVSDDDQNGPSTHPHLQSPSIRIT